MAADKLPSQTRPCPAFTQGRPPSSSPGGGGNGGEASPCVGAAASARPRRFSTRFGDGRGDRGGAVSPDANGGGRGEVVVVLALPAAARHVCPVCSKIFHGVRALNGHKRSCRPPAPANPPAPLPEQQGREKKPRLAAETSWAKTRPRSARLRRVLPSSSDLLDSAGGPTVIVIDDDDEEEDADSAVEIDSSVVTIAISDPHPPPAIVPAAPAPSVDPAMAFWTFSAAAAAAYDHGYGAASGGPMAPHQNAHGRPPVIRSTRLFGADVFFVVQAGSYAE